MARTTVDDCLSDKRGYFQLAHDAARRAREITNRNNSRVPEYDDKPIVVALREVAEENKREDSEENNIA